eukprot:m.130153 g.130153  ORF g.130153 m.130153 type:complete len:292 (+) comp14595_c0_seq7:88-963(+)
MTEPSQLPPFLVWLFVTAIVVVINTTTQDFWKSFKDAPDEHDPGPWCEEDRPNDFLREPANAFSDLAYFALAMKIVTHAQSDYTAAKSGTQPANFVAANYWVSVIGVVLNIIHFLGSFMNHACRCHTGHRMDVFGMYVAIFYLIWVIFCSLVVKILAPYPDMLTKTDLTKNLPALYAVMGFGAICFWFLSDLYYHDHRCKSREDFVVTGLVIVGLGMSVVIARLSSSEKRKKSSSRWIIIAVVALGLGKIAQEMDQNKILCYPKSLIQGHAIWHVATAIAMYCGYMHLRSL